MKIIEKSGGGPRGKGSIKVLDENKVQVSITDWEDKTSMHILEFPQGVQNVQIETWKLQSANDVSINLTDDELDFQYTPRPRNGTFFVKFARFAAEEGELPSIKFEEKRDYEGKPWLPERYKAFALYEVLNPGMYQGMELLDTITYEFEWDDILGEFTIVSNKKKRHEHLLTFLNVFGFDLQNDELHYTAEDYDAGGPTTIPNVLPELEDILRSRKRLAQVTVENGWVQEDSIRPAPYGITEETLRNMPQPE